MQRLLVTVLARVFAFINRVDPRRARGGVLVGTTTDPYVPSLPMDRKLSNDEEAALRWILHVEDFPGAEELRGQVPLSRVVFGRTTELELAIDGGRAAALPDGHLGSTALVVDASEQPIGHIDVWLKGGFLSSLDYSWFTDQMPREYPSLDQLRLWDPVLIMSDVRIRLPEER